MTTSLGASVGSPWGIDPGLPAKTAGGDAVKDFVTSFGELDDLLFGDLVQDFLRSPGPSFSLSIPELPDDNDDSGEVCQIPRRFSDADGSANGEASPEDDDDGHHEGPQRHHSSFTGGSGGSASTTATSLPCILPIAPTAPAPPSLPVTADSLAGASSSQVSSCMAPAPFQPLLGSQPSQLQPMGFAPSYSSYPAPTMGTASMGFPMLGFPYSCPALPATAQPDPNQPKKRGRKKQPDPRQVLAQKEAELQRLHWENQLLRQRNSVLEIVINCRNEQLARLQQAASFKEPTPEEMATFMPCCSAAGGPLGAVPFDNRMAYFFRDRTAEELGLGYKKHLAGLSAALLNTSPTAQQELESSMLNLNSITKCIFLVNPEAMKMLTTPVDDVSGAVPDVQHWCNVVQACSISPQQVQELLILHQLYNAWTNRVVAERARLTQELTAALAGSTSKYGQIYKDGTLEAPETMLLDLLHRNVVRERCLYVLLLEVMFNKMLTPAQGAKMMVQSYPFVPDIAAILDALARLCGSQQVLLQQQQAALSAGGGPMLPAPAVLGGQL